MLKAKKLLTNIYMPITFAAQFKFNPLKQSIMKRNIELPQNFFLSLSADGEYYRLEHRQSDGTTVLVCCDSACEDWYNEDTAVAMAESVIDLLTDYDAADNIHGCHICAVTGDLLPDDDLADVCTSDGRDVKVAKSALIEYLYAICQYGADACVTETYQDTYELLQYIGAATETETIGKDSADWETECAKLDIDPNEADIIHLGVNGNAFSYSLDGEY